MKRKALGIRASALALLLALVAGAGCTTEHVFTFAVVADPHIGVDEHAERLRAVVDWINRNREDMDIELVFVLGDIGGGPDSLVEAREILASLQPPSLPVIGDNPIQGGNEDAFHNAFHSHLVALAGELDGWSRAPTPVWNPEREADSHLQNYSFDHKGVHFMGIDWCTRIQKPIVGEQADLHDFPGGSFPWFQADIAGCAKELQNNIVMMTHHPMHDITLGIGGFDAEEQRRVEECTALYGDHVYANFAGHYHLNAHGVRPAGGFHVYITDGTWDDANTFRLVEVSRSETRFFYQHMLVTLYSDPSETVVRALPLEESIEGQAS